MLSLSCRAYVVQYHIGWLSPLDVGMLDNNAVPGAEVVDRKKKKKAGASSISPDYHPPPASKPGAGRQLDLQWWRLKPRHP